MKPYKKFILFISILFFSAKAFTQNTADVSQNNFMYENGKIYVVVVVATVIVIGLFLYLLNLDRKISKLEKKK